MGKLALGDLLHYGPPLLFGLLSAVSLPLGALTLMLWKPRDRVVAALMAFGGLRRGETLALRRADVDFSAGVLHVCRQRVRVGGQLVTAPPKS